MVNASLAINIPREVLLGVGSALVFLILAVHLILGMVWLIESGQLSARNAKWQQLLPDKNVLDGIHKETAGLTQQVKTISDMTINQSLVWAPKFNAISDALPKGLWLRKMSFDKSGLSMDGSVVSKNQSEINNVGLFLSALKQNNGFMKGFSSLEVNSIQRSKAQAVETTDFTVMAKSK
jgi:Tfp pilus assembly protein PilN